MIQEVTRGEQHNLLLVRTRSEVEHCQDYREREISARARFNTRPWVSKRPWHRYWLALIDVTTIKIIKWRRWQMVRKSVNPAATMR